ncbi:MAG TPA: outer membrane lipoprotein carrier protein LolA [Alphaproteobacteria bacterium]|nr:outer membrane lipoprotein carrier protein LolA [Alphaproteobacteria bacterium]
MATMRALLRSTILAAGLALAGAGAVAGTPKIPATPENKADLARIEQYLTGIRSMQARFLQQAGGGGLSEGTVYLERPGKMRFEYDPPSTTQIVADGTWLFFWDGELKQITQVPLGSTLADFIVRSEPSFTQGVTVTGLERGAGTIEVTLVSDEDPDAGTLSLIFSDAPLELKKWRIVDSQGVPTEVALLDPAIGLPLDRKKFVFIRPEW